MIFKQKYGGNLVLEEHLRIIRILTVKETDIWISPPPQKCSRYMQVQRNKQLIGGADSKANKLQPLNLTSFSFI